MADTQSSLLSLRGSPNASLSSLQVLATMRLKS